MSTTWTSKEVCTQEAAGSTRLPPEGPETSWDKGRGVPTSGRGWEVFWGLGRVSRKAKRWKGLEMTVQLVR